MEILEICRFFLLVLNSFLIKPILCFSFILNNLSIAISEIHILYSCLTDLHIIFSIESILESSIKIVLTTMLTLVLLIILSRSNSMLCRVELIQCKI